MLIVSGIARFIIEDNENSIELAINCDELEVTVEDSNEKSMGAEISYSVTLDNGEVQAEWHAYEYPLGTLELFELQNSSAEIVEDFNFSCTLD